MHRYLALSKGLIWRQRRLFSIRLLFCALLFGVFSIATISTVTQVLKANLFNASTDFLAADKQLKSPRKAEDEWLAKAESLGLQWSAAIEFSTMLSANNRYQLVSVKAVDEKYPLKGSLTLRKEGKDVVTANGPLSNKAWLHQRLFSLLDIRSGQSVGIGESEFLATSILRQEPDTSFQLAGLAPRVMIPLAMLEKTKVIQPGSRATWTYYFAGNDDSLSKFENWLVPKLSPSYRWQGLRDGRPAISKALDRAESYLMLGGSVSVLLAALAIAICSKQFGREQVQTIAVTKALGARGRELIGAYVLELLVMVALVWLFGLVLALLASNAWVYLLREAQELEGLEYAFLSVDTLLLSFATALIFLFAFCVPQLMKLITIPPVRVLRGSLAEMPESKLVSTLLAGVGAGILLLVYSGSWSLVLGLVASVSALCLVLVLGHWGLMRTIVAWLASRARQGSILNYTLKRILRDQRRTLLNLTVFSLAIFLFVFLFVARTTLIDDWQAQLPPDTPNHFLVNVPPNELGQISEYLQSQEIETSGIYPMVRGRLSHINGVAVKVAITKDVAALNRELNLTWSERLPSDNQILDGSWWGSHDQKFLESEAYQGVSVESKLAEKLGLELGDDLMFMIGGTSVTARVASIRSVKWDSMRPNFYMMFPAGSLEQFPATYITSFYLSSDQKDTLNLLSMRFPTVSIIELDSLVSKLRSIVSQVANMIEIVVLFVFISSLLVLSALVASTKAERVYEVVLYRTLGASKRFIHGTQLLEFFALGLISGLGAVVFADAALWFVQKELFGGTFHGHFILWGIVPILAGIVLGLFGFLQTYKVPAISPMTILRSR